MKKSIVLFLFFICLIIGLISPGEWFRSVFIKKEKLLPDTIKEVITEETREIVIPGILNPAEIIEIGSQISGRITKVYVDFNSSVKRGDVLAELDQSAIKERIRQCEAGIKNIEISLRKAELRKEIARLKKERRLTLFKNNLISREEKEDLEANQSLLEADIESLNQNLEQMKSQLESNKIDSSYTVITAPIDGVVLERKVNEGQTVVTGFQAPILFRIADLKKMQIECNIDERYLNYIKEGKEVDFDIAYTTHKFKGRIKQIRYFPRIVEGTARYPTIIEVDNSEMKLIPGVVRVRLEEKLN